MTTHTLCNGPAGTGHLVITARPGKGSGGHPVWLVDVCRWGRHGKTLDRTAAWLPGFDCWDETRWFPSNPRQVPPAVLRDVVAWLRGREVASIEHTTTETPMSIDFRALCVELLNSLETLYKQSVTAPCNQTLEIGGVRHAIPIGIDILAQDCLYCDLITRVRAALAQPEEEV